MTDVGKELGLSHALLYRFVESKEALFQLAVLGAAVPDRLSELPIPLPTPSPGEVLEPIADWTTGKTAFPLVKAALTTDECEDIRREFHGVIDEYYAAIEDNRALLSLLERSAADIPELGELYFGKPRQGQVDLLAEYCGASLPIRPPPTVPGQRHSLPSSSSRQWRGSRGTGDHPMPIEADDESARQSVHVLLAAALIPDFVEHADQ